MFFRLKTFLSTPYFFVIELVTVIAVSFVVPLSLAILCLAAVAQW